MMRAMMEKTVMKKKSDKGEDEDDDGETLEDEMGRYTNCVGL